MSISTAVAEELKGLNENQLKSIYRIIQSFKKKKSAPRTDIPLDEIWRITSKTSGNWSKDVEKLREERF